MMKITSVICEYNPFHLGHAYQISEMKKRGAVIAVMSGSFTQRGTPAILSKYERAQAAVCGGADLVLELPFPYCSSRADIFGAAGVRIASALGCVDELCFGSETGNVEALIRINERLASDTFRKALADRLAESHALSQRTVSAEVYAELYGKETALEGSNDILSLAYLAAIREQKSTLRPVAIQRIGERYDGSGTGFASATSVRSALLEGNTDKIKNAVPPESARLLCDAIKTGTIANEENLYVLFAMLMRTGREEALLRAPDTPADLASRMAKAAKQAESTERLIALTQTRRFSPSRIRRAMLYAVTGVTASDLGTVPYTTVLAANETGRKILSAIRKSAAFPIVTKPADANLFGEEIEKAFSLCARADSIWTLLTDTPAPGNRMMKEHPRML